MDVAMQTVHANCVREADGVMLLGEYHNDPLAGVLGTVVAITSGMVWVRPVGSEKLVPCDGRKLQVIGGAHYAGNN